MDAAPTRRADLAADLCAEVFAAALSSAHRFRGSGPPAEAWLFGIARNVLRLERAERHVVLGEAGVDRRDERFVGLEQAAPRPFLLLSGPVERRGTVPCS